MAIIGHAGLLLNVLDSATQSLIDRSSTPVPNDQTDRTNDAIIALKDQGIWGKLDAFVIASKWQDEQAGLLDWIRPVSFVKRGSASWDATYGYVGDSALGSCIDSMFSPSADCANASLDNFSAFAYVSAVGSNAMDYLFSCNNSGGTTSLQLFESTSDAMDSRAFSIGNTYTAASKAATGLMCLSRTASSAVTIRHNGTNITTGGGSAASVSLMADTIALVGNNNNGSYSGSSAKVAAWGFGSALSEAEQTALKTIIDNYLV